MTKRNKMKALEQEQERPIVEILQEAFEEHGTQQAVADSLGVSQSTISLWLLRLGLTPQIVLIPTASNDNAAPLQQEKTRPEVSTTTPQSL